MTGRASGSGLAALGHEPHADDQFDDPRYAWRRMFSELLGTTFLLVLAAAGGPVVNAVSHGRVSLSAQAVAPGLMVMAVIYFMGAVGGAHLNPAVTLSFALRGNFPWRRVPRYIAMQIVGAVVAAAFLRAMFGNVGQLGATLPMHGISGVKVFLLEAVLTVGLVSVILGTASGHETSARTPRWPSAPTSR